MRGTQVANDTGGAGIGPTRPLPHPAEITTFVVVGSVGRSVICVALAASWPLVAAGMVDGSFRFSALVWGCAGMVAAAGSAFAARHFLLRPLTTLTASARALRGGHSPAPNHTLPAEFASLHADMIAFAEASAAASRDAVVYRIVAESTVDVIVRCDANRLRTYVSPSCAEVLGYTQTEMLGGHAFRLVHREDNAYVTAIFDGLGPQNTRASAVFRMLRKDGNYAWIEGRYRYLTDDGGFVSVLRDITIHKRVEALLADTNERLEAANVSLAAQASQDGLTGLANRRHFDKVLEEEFRRAARLELPLALILLDVDHFKSYNDRYGHPAGDDCLRAVSAAVLGLLRRGDEQAARYGGEEITVLLPGVDEIGARQVAQRIVDAVREIGIAHRDSPFGVVTVSAGVSGMMPGRAGEPRALVETADRALYWAKSAGRNMVQIHSPALRAADALSAASSPFAMDVA